MKKILLFAFLVFIYNSLPSISADKNNSIQEINLNSPHVKIETATNNLNWTELKKNTTNKAFRAFGKPINVGGYSSVDANSIEKIALSFVEENEQLLGVDKSQVEYHSANFVNGKWYVHLKQVTNGLTVIFSNIELRVNKKAQVFAYGVEYFEVDKAELEPQISFNEAYSKEALNISNTESVLQESKSGELFAFPVYENGKYKLVAAYKADYNALNREYSAYISSIDGSTLFRKNMTHDLQTTVEVFTNIKEVNLLSPIVKVPVANQTVKVNEKNYITDKNGLIELDLDNSEQVTVKFEGPWVNFRNELFTEGQIITEIVPGENNLIEWDDSNSSIEERMAVYHLDEIREYITTLDTAMTAMDLQITLRFLNRSGGANAFSSGEVIGYIGLNDVSTNLVETPSVMYHEYGHSINKLLFIDLGQLGGMYNGAANEGTADINAAFYQDDSRVGYRAYKDTSRFLRNCKNEFKYPTDLIGEVHHDGQILSGALWDMRELTDLETARKLAHFARYGLPDDNDIGVCYSEWLLEILIADDDDGDLTNGTPHGTEIVTAFNNHNITLDVLLETSLWHVQQAQLTSNNDQINIAANLNTVVNFYQDSLELSLVYTFDNFKTTTEIPFKNYNQESGDFNYTISKERDYGIVGYYFNLKNVTTDEDAIKLKTRWGQTSFYHEYGLAEKYRDDLLSEDWVFSRDEEIGAEFEIAVSEFSFNNGGDILQTRDSFEDEDEICLVTGAKFVPGTYWTNMPYTYLDAISPNIDIRKYTYPVFKFSLWYSKNKITPESDVDFYLDISSDGGENWIDAYKLDDQITSSGVWNTSAIILKDNIEFTKYFKYRVRVVPNSSFNYSAGYPNCFTEFQVDNITISDLASISSVEELEDKSYQITVDKDYINIYSTIIDNNISISLFDINGKLIRTSSDNSDRNIKLDRNNLTKGVYFVEINNGVSSITKKVLLSE